MKNSSFVTIFNRVTFTARAIMRNSNLTVEDIDSLWRDSILCDGSSIDRFKLNRDRNTIFQLYGIDIQPRRVENGDYCYYVKNKHRLTADGLLDWNFNSLSIMELLKGYTKLKDRIFLEEYAPDPHIMVTILQAMENNNQMTIHYKRFTNMETKIHIVEPFCIRSYQHRIYVVARIVGHKNPCVFSLDRIEYIELLKTKFRMPHHFSPEEFFADAFGVMVADNMKPERVVIRAYGDEMHYIASKPLHHSQERISYGFGKGYADFGLFLAPTLDFMGYILSRADRLEVVSPQWLRDRIVKSHVDSALLYKSATAPKK